MTRCDASERNHPISGSLLSGASVLSRVIDGKPKLTLLCQMEGLNDC